MHNFTLLHDDIIDSDHTRRHRPTAWSVFGAPAAILAGDALLALALHTVAAHPSRHVTAATRMLNSSLIDLVNGQTTDLAFESRAEVSLQEALTMTAGKTASLLGCACTIGPLLAGATKQQVQRFQAFGHHLGLAFQLVDDLLGIWGNPALTGKPVRSDLRARKKSLPVVAALTAGTPAANRLAQLYLRAEPLSDAELAEASALIEQAGGRAWTQQEAARHITIALSHLRALHPASEPAELLEALATSVIQRNH